MPPARLSRIAGKSALSEPPSRSSTVRISSISSAMGRAVVRAQFAPDQIAGLYSGRSLIDRRDARVAQILRGAGLLDEAHSAMHLHPERGYVDPELGAPALEHRGQQVDPLPMPMAFDWIRMLVREIDVGGQH